MHNGTAYRQPPSAPLTAVIGYGSWPTLVASDSWTHSLASSQVKPGSRHSLTLSRAVLLPTLVAADSERASLTYGRGNLTLTGAAKLLPTLCASDSKVGDSKTQGLQVKPNGTVVRVDKNGEEWGPRLAALVQGSEGGFLNPLWAEWFMGFPTGWIGDAESTPTETPSSPRPQNTSAASSSLPASPLEAVA